MRVLLFVRRRNTRAERAEDPLVDAFRLLFLRLSAEDPPLVVVLKALFVRRFKARAARAADWRLTLLWLLFRFGGI